MASTTTKTQPKELYGSNLVQFIIGEAEKLNLDPAAVLAVAGHEGGFNGAVGDNGTSFGPFQLHQGGKLPSGLNATQAKAFANSPAGVDYALSGIAGVAAGQTGTGAVSSIVTKFEQPKNPSAEVTAASADYPKLHQIVGLVEKNGPGGLSVSGKGGGFNLLDFLFGKPLKPNSSFSSAVKQNAQADAGSAQQLAGAVTGATFSAFFGVSASQAAQMVAGALLVGLGIIIIVRGSTTASPAAQTRGAIAAVKR